MDAVNNFLFFLTRKYLKWYSHSERSCGVVYRVRDTIQSTDLRHISFWIDINSDRKLLFLSGFSVYIMKHESMSHHAITSAYLLNLLYIYSQMVTSVYEIPNLTVSVSLFHSHSQFHDSQFSMILQMYRVSIICRLLAGTSACAYRLCVTNICDADTDSGYRNSVRFGCVCVHLKALFSSFFLCCRSFFIYFHFSGLRVHIFIFRLAYHPFLFRYNFFYFYFRHSYRYWQPFKPPNVWDKKCKSSSVSWNASKPAVLASNNTANDPYPFNMRMRCKLWVVSCELDVVWCDTRVNIDFVLCMSNVFRIFTSVLSLI